VIRLLRGFWAAPVVFAVLLYLAFPNDLMPRDLGFLAVPAWAVLLLSLRLRKGERAFRQAFVGGFLFFVGGLTWIAPLVGGGWIFTAAWCACFEGLYAWLLARFWLRAGRRNWVVPGALLHLLIDMLRTIFMTGFPWLLTGYTGWDNPVLIGSADLLGVHGATLAIMLVAAGIAETLARKIEREDRVLMPLVPGVVFVVLLAAWAQAHRLRVYGPPGGGPVVALLQGNIPQLLKEDRDASGEEATPKEVWWQTHIDLIDEAYEQPRPAPGKHPIDVIVWPETMVPVPADRDFTDPRTQELFGLLARMSRGAQTLAGILTVERDAAGNRVQAWNSMVLLDGSGTPRGVQDKQHRTPGGEYIPLMHLLPFKEWLRRLLMEKAGFVPDLAAGEGNVLLPVQHADGTSQAGVLICYESIFPSISRGMARDGADFLLNASNYGWFVGTPLMDQCVAMCCFRSAETGRPMVITSNNGVSGVIDTAGRLGGRRSMVFEDDRGRRTDVPGVLVAELPGETNWTPFLLWGEWAAWLLGLAGLVTGWLHRRRSA